MRIWIVVALLLTLTVAAAQAAPSKESKMKGAFLGSLVADALTLGTHYEYDAKKIRQFYGAIDRYYAPGEKTGGQTHGVGWGARNFHNGNGNGPAKRAGEQTDYGDYVLLVGEHLAETSKDPHRIDLKELVPRWQKALKTWRSWICTQTKQTLQQVKSGMPLEQIGGMSNAMGVRGPALLAYHDKEDDVVASARASLFTHKNNQAHSGNEFFMRVAYRIIHQGKTPREAITEVASLSDAFVKQKVQQAIDKVAEALDETRPLHQEEFADDLALTSMARLWDVGKTEPIKVGKASPTEGTLPGSVYFILKYQDDFAQAVRANAEVGGDCASRAVAIGMVLGAHLGVEAIPSHLGKNHLVEWNRAQGYLNQMPLLRNSKVEL